MFELPVGDIRLPIKKVEISEEESIYIFQSHYERDSANFMLNFILDHPNIDFSLSDFHYALEDYLEKEIGFSLVVQEIYEIYAPELSDDLNVEFHFDALQNKIEFKRIGDNNCGCSI